MQAIRDAYAADPTTPDHALLDPTLTRPGRLRPTRPPGLGRRLGRWAGDDPHPDRRAAPDRRPGLRRPPGPRPRGDPGWGQLPGAGLPRRRRHPAVHGERPRPVAHRRRRARLRRPGLQLGADDPRPRAPGRARGRARGRRPRASPSARPPRTRCCSPRRSSPGSTPVEQVRLVSSGTEATMSAIRLARGFTGRSLVVKFAGHYHGHVDSLLVSAGSGVATLALPDSRGRADRDGRRDPRAALQRRRGPRGRLRGPRRRDRLPHHRGGRRQHGRRPAGRRVHRRRCAGSPPSTARCSSPTRS